MSKKNYTRDCIAFKFANKSKKNKVDQCCFDCINSNCQKQKCVTSICHFNDVLCKHYYNHNKNDDQLWNYL